MIWESSGRAGFETPFLDNGFAIRPLVGLTLLHARSWL